MRRVVPLAIAGIAVVIAVTVCLRRGEERPDQDGEAVAPAARKSAQAAARNARPSSSRSARPRRKPVLDMGDDDDDRRTPAEKALAERIEKALDDEDFELAIGCAEEAQKCGVVEIRQSMVETLGWFGEKALPELTPFLLDPDEDVRDDAKIEWATALAEIEDDGAKAKVVELAMCVLDDEDSLEELSGEFIGIDEKIAVEALSRIIANGRSGKGVAKAKETYEFVTGEEWEGAEAAARWIEEEYEPTEGE